VAAKSPARRISTAPHPRSLNELLINELLINELLINELLINELLLVDVTALGSALTSILEITIEIAVAGRALNDAAGAVDARSLERIRSGAWRRSGRTAL